MLSKRMLDALNEQVNAEFYASYLYLSMATYFEERNLNGFAHWMKAQWQEEIGHAMKIYGYINERGGRVTLKGIGDPATQFASPLDCFEKALEHEIKVTGMINNLVDIADEEKDRATHVFLHWFIKEQVEEEASVNEVIDMLKMVGDKGQALMMVDRQLAQRGAGK